MEDKYLAQMNKMNAEIDAVQNQFDAEMTALRGWTKTKWSFSNKFHIKIMFFLYQMINFSSKIVFSTKQIIAQSGKKSKQKEAEEGEKPKEFERRKKNIKKQYPTIDQLREEYDNTVAIHIVEEEEPLYFKDVQQLLDIFATLEESWRKKI